MATAEELHAVKAKHSQKLLGTAGVSGVGIEKDDAGDHILTVYLSDPAARSRLPATLDGYPVRYTITGPFEKR